MYLIEPCCAKRHMLRLRNAVRNGGTAEFEGYGDLSLSELLPAILTRYSETEMMIVAPSLPDQAAEAVGTWMRRQWARSDGRGRLDVIRRLTVVAALDGESSPMASLWLGDNPFGERLTLVDMEQDSTAILLPDFAITGPVNMRYGHRFTATATTDAGKVGALWEKYGGMAGNAPAGEEPAAEEPAEAEPAPAPKARRKRTTKAKPKEMTIYGEL